MAKLPWYMYVKDGQLRFNKLWILWIRIGIFIKYGK